MCKVSVCFRTRFFIKSTQRDIKLIHISYTVVGFLAHHSALVRLGKDCLADGINLAPQCGGVVCVFVLIYHNLCFGFCIYNLFHTCKGSKTCIITLTTLVDKVLQGLCTLRMLLLIFRKVLLCITLCHYSIAFKTVFSHHIIGQFLALCCIMCKFGYFFKHWLEQ